ncbi:MAG: hypothetical protein ACLTMP_14675 [Eggerthella lenta]
MILSMVDDLCSTWWPSVRLPSTKRTSFPTSRAVRGAGAVRARLRRGHGGVEVSMHCWVQTIGASRAIAVALMILISAIGSTRSCSRDPPSSNVSFPRWRLARRRSASR